MIHQDHSQNWCTYSGTWIQYPPMVITTSSFDDQSVLSDFINIEFEIDPSSGTFLLGTLNEQTGAFTQTGSQQGHSFSYGREAKVRIEWTGHHAFSVNKVKIWDDGYDQFVVEQDEDLLEDIGDEFVALYNNQRPALAGWMHDDYAAAFIEQEAVLSKIFSDRGLPPMLSSSYKGDRTAELYDALDALNAPHPISAIENYWFQSDAVCRSSHKDIPPNTSLYTDPDSDSPYADAEINTNCPAPLNSNCSSEVPRYDGSYSLQYALDQGVFGGDEDYYDLAYWDPVEGLLERVQLEHSYGTKFWSILQAGKWRHPDGDDDCGDNTRSKMRCPTENELKLSVWLSVACVVDGSVEEQ